jgi:predicted dehydrogenase
MADLSTTIPQRLRPTSSVETFARSDATGEPVTVTTEDMAGVLLRFSGGARGVLTLSQVSPGRKNNLSFEVSGAGASLAWGLENPEQLWIGHRDGPNQIQLREVGDYPPGHAQGYPDAFKALFRAVYAAIESGKAAETHDYPTFDDGLEQVLVGEAIAESARVGQWVPVRR